MFRDLYFCFVFFFSRARKRALHAKRCTSKCWLLSFTDQIAKSMPAAWMLPSRCLTCVFQPRTFLRRPPCWPGSIEHRHSEHGHIEHRLSEHGRARRTSGCLGLDLEETPGSEWLVITQTASHSKASYYYPLCLSTMFQTDSKVLTLTYMNPDCVFYWYLCISCSCV
jgi:hypothetical protein